MVVSRRKSWRRKKGADWTSAEEWNNDHPVGTLVRYWTGDIRLGAGEIGKTRSVAFGLDGSARVLITGCSSAVVLSHVEPFDVPGAPGSPWQ